MPHRTPRFAPSRRCLTALATLALAAGLSAPAVHAQAQAQPQAWPTKPVKLIVPFPPGAAPDVVARLLGERMAQAWGQGVYVDNRPGAGGIPGMSALAHAPNDGHTLGFVPAAAATLTPLLYRNPQFSIDADLLPIAVIGTSPMMVVVNASTGIASLADLARHAKERPGKVNFAAAQPNSVPHLTGEMLSRSAGLGLFTVPYSGSQAAVTAVLAGDAVLTVDGLPALVQHVKGGKLRAIAVTSDKRLPGFDDVPTVAETYRGFESVGWFAIFAPAGLPQPLAERINRDVNKVLQQPDLVARLAELGVYPRPGDMQSMKDFLREQRAASRKVVADLGLQPQ